MKLVCGEASCADLGDLAGLFDVVASQDAVRTEGELYLFLEDAVLKLCRAGDRRGVFVEPAELARRAGGDFLLGRACGLRGGIRPRLLDATAGLGVDGLALAGRGARVHLVERNPVLWAMLANLLERSNLQDTELSLADNQQFLDSEMPYDVIYFDPMFAPRSKSALPGKRMQYVSALLQRDASDSAEIDSALIQHAQSCASSRVVLKRRAKDLTIGDPDWCIRGRSVRYDVYQGHAAR